MSETTTQVSVDDANVVTIIFRRENGGALGIKPIQYEGNIYVESVLRGCMVDLDGRILRGDIILQVNNQKLPGMSTEEATNFLREITKKPGRVLLKIIKSQYETRSETEPAAELPPPYTEQRSGPRLDMEAWIAYTEAMRSEASIAPTSLYTGSEIQPRRGVDHVITPSAPLSIEDSSRLDVVRRMAADGSGLEVKNRMWLKIEITNAFMGKNLIKWLRENVEGLYHAKDAKRYAVGLLQAGLVLQTMGTGTEFSDKAYYTFNTHLLRQHNHYQSNENLTINQELMDDIPDSVSQIAGNQDFRFPDLEAFSFPRSDGTLTRRHNSRSSGGSGNSTDRLLRPVVYEEVDAQGGVLSSRYAPGLRRLTNPSSDVTANSSSFKMAMGRY